jgi:hypothetical protein
VSGLDPSSLDREKAQALVPIAIRRTASGHSRRFSDDGDESGLPPLAAVVLQARRRSENGQTDARLSVRFA